MLLLSNENKQTARFYRERVYQTQTAISSQTTKQIQMKFCITSTSFYQFLVTFFIAIRIKISIA